MKFYQLTLETKRISKTKKTAKTDRESVNQYLKFISDAGKRFCDTYFKTTKPNDFFFIFDYFQDNIYCGYATPDKVDLDYVMGFPWDKMQVEIKTIAIEEITSRDFGEATNVAKTCGFFYKNLEYYLKIFNPGPLYDWQDGYDGAICGYTEDVLKETDSQKQTDLVNQAKKMLWKNELVKEVNNIFNTPNPGIPCHPVHYFVESDNAIHREYAMRILLNALYKNKRISSRRISYLLLNQLRISDLSYIDEMFKTAEGGTVIVDMTKSVQNSSSFLDDVEVSQDDAILSELSNIIKKYRNSVLTVFYLPKQCTEEKSKIYEELQDFCFVELFEDPLTKELIDNFIQVKAQICSVDVDNNLLKQVENVAQFKTLEDVNKVFESWYSNKIKSEYYTNYSSLAVAKKYATNKKKTNAMQELDNMIGLEKAKETIKQAVDFYKLQKLYKDRGINKNKPAMHMIFKGDPGTAKTSVARLFARILKENNVLNCGHLVECGRADLVGKYVGWTANQVKKKFQEAKEGVLFIDEAYSLVEDREGSFGDEAINTIVQEMENHRDEVVVIFAGYPDKMEEFLNKNPGLRSRIGFHIDFSNYTTEDLLKIAEKLAKEQNLYLSKDVNKKLKTIFDNARQSKDFGNGRYVRNLIEKARLKQASRLVNSKNYEKLSDKELLTLKASDFDVVDIDKNEKISEIGFKG